MPRIRRYLRESGCIRPVPRVRRIGYITAGGREEVSRGIAAGDSARTIAERLERSPSTSAREIARNGGRERYRAMDADTAAYVRTRRPKISTLYMWPILRETVTSELYEQWSPQQTSAWLRRENSADPKMRVSYEAIYRCIYIPSRKVFDSNIFHELRTDRPIRRLRGKKCSFTALRAITPCRDDLVKIRTQTVNRVVCRARPPDPLGLSADRTAEMLRGVLSRDLVGKTMR